jgi:hypothetical protein
MTALGKNARLRFSINNKIVDAPIEWEDITFKADFDDGAIQPSIDIDSFNFAPEEAQIIRKWISDGRIFEGLPFKVDTYNATSSINNFKGYINCSDNVEIFDDRTISAKIQKADGMDSLNDRLSGTTLSYLESVGVFKDSDYTRVKYVVEKSNNGMEILMSSVVLFIMVKELQNQIRQTAKDISNGIAHVSGGISGTIAGAVFAVAVAIIQIVYTAVLIAAIIQLALKLFDILLPIVRTHKTLNLRTALSKISSHLGYNLVSPITELDRLHYLPSNNQTDEINLTTGLINFPKGTSKGIPNEQDFGFTASEFFDLCKRMFNAKVKIIGNELHLRSENDPFWKQTATYKMPDVLLPVKRYNTDEFIFSRLIKFETDEIADEWTLNNFKGTNYEIITDDVSITNNEAKYLRNHETISFPVALGNRKDKLNGLENILAELAGVIDGLVNFFGGNSNLKSKIKNKVGMLKVGTNNTTKPKILYLNSSNKLPSNHRRLFSAKVLYDKYINEKSFVLNNFGGQKAVYSVENLPFGFEDYLKTIDNSNFTDSSNKMAKFRFANWLISGDEASVEFEQHEVYAPNLTEKYIEQE